MGGGLWRTHSLLAIVMNLLATHLCRDGPPVPLRKGSPLTVELLYVFAIFHTETCTRGQSAHPKIPLEKFSPSGGVSSGILPSRGILKNIILCRHKTFNPPEGLIPCMPCRGKTYKIPLAFFSISTPAGFNLVENSGGKT